MAVFNLYFASCVLLLTLSWRTSMGNPVPSLSPEKCAECPPLFKSLQLNVKGLLSSEVCKGILPDMMEITSKAETVESCAPTPTQNPGCMPQRNSSFNENECLSNIMKDLVHYADVITSYSNSQIQETEKVVPLLNTTLGIIQSLKNCSLMKNGSNNSLKEDVAQMWGTDTFNNRQKMCKTMRGFHVRTITFNRAMGYISSGDHK